jgi:hypothetical protein
VAWGNKRWLNIHQGPFKEISSLIASAATIAITAKYVTVNRVNNIVQNKGCLALLQQSEGRFWVEMELDNKHKCHWNNIFVLNIT